MPTRLLAASLAFLCLAVGAVRAQEKDDPVPKEAVCTTCEVRGSTHGEEGVVAWREYRGARHYFCSKACAEVFDGFPAAYIPHPIPRPAPSTSLSLLGGEALELDALKGRVVLLDFWATWCKPCRKAMPMLNELHAEWPDTSLAVIGVSIDEKAEDVVPRFVRKEKLSYPIALDTGERPAWYEFYVAAIPAMFLIDRDGRIVAEWRGEIDIDEVRRAVEGQLKAPATND